MLNDRHLQKLLSDNDEQDITLVMERLATLVQHIKLESRKKIKSLAAIERKKSALRTAAAASGDWQPTVAFCVAQMNRVHRIHIYNLQLVPLILFFERTNMGGDAVSIFFEVLTGEGKTLLIALIAAACVLLGRGTVDIITATDVLADANCDAMRTFYAALGLRVRTNSTDADSEDYDIVYGSLYHFARDYLRQALLQTTPTPPHVRNVCIVDEVDLLAIDNSEHAVKMARPFPGMEMLLPLYSKLLLADSANEAISIDVGSVPKHLHAYCTHMADIWRRSVDVARAKSRHVDFMLREDGRVVVPIDPHSGKIMHGAAFANGVQQFIELKGHYTLSCEILDSITISNYGYVRLYHTLCGLTGTLGAAPEVALLRRIFPAARCYRIPPYHPSALQWHAPLYDRNEQIKYVDMRAHRLLYDGNQRECYEFVGYTMHNRMIHYCGCFYRDGKLTREMLKLNRVIADNVYAFTSASSYQRCLAQTIAEYLTKSPDQNVYILNANMRVFPEEYCNHKRVVIVKNIDIEDIEPESTHLFLFDMKFDSRAICNDLLLIEKFMPEYMIAEPSRHYGVYTLVHAGRAVLLIFDTIQAVEYYAYTFTYLSEQMQLAHRIIKYVGAIDAETPSIDAINPVRPGDIILTTNIGARGTDYLITPELRKNGGIHVVLTYVPRNERLQRQAIGRTARNGQPGSAQFVLESDNATTSIDERLAQRDTLYAEELHSTHAAKFPRLEFYDALHREFRAFIADMRHNGGKLAAIRVADLSEYWAIWLKLHEAVIYSPKENNTVAETFTWFLHDAQHIVDESGYHNPVCAARRAGVLLANHEQDYSEKATCLLQATLDDTVYCRGLLQEFKTFAKIAIRRRRAVTIARQALCLARDNNLPNCDKYLALLDDQHTEIILDETQVKQTVAAHITKQQTTPKPIKANAKTLSLMLATGVVALRKKKPLDALRFIGRGVATYCRRTECVRTELERCGAFLGGVCNKRQTAAGVALLAYSACFDNFFHNIIAIVKDVCKEEEKDEGAENTVQNDIEDLAFLLERGIDDVVRSAFAAIDGNVLKEDVQRILEEECRSLNELRGNIIDAMYVPLVSALDDENVRQMFEVLRRRNVEINVRKVLARVRYVCERICARVDAIDGDVDCGEVCEDNVRAFFDFVPMRFAELAMQLAQVNIEIDYDHITEFAING